MYTKRGQTRVTFQVDKLSTAILLQMFEGDVCNPNYYNKKIKWNKDYQLYKELSEWDVIRMEAFSLSHQLLADIYKPVDGFIFHPFKFHVVVYKAGWGRIVINLRTICIEFQPMFKKILEQLDDVAKVEMEDYARDLRHQWEAIQSA